MVFDRVGVPRRASVRAATAQVSYADRGRRISWCIAAGFCVAAACSSNQGTSGAPSTVYSSGAAAGQPTGSGASAGATPGHGGAGGGQGALGFSTDSGYTPPSTGGAPTVPSAMLDASAPSIPYTPPSTDPTPLSIDDCTGMIDAATFASLQQGGATSGARYLYPYDGTVFPVGLPPPKLQWQGPTPADSVYLHLKSKFFEYKGCFGSNTTLDLAVPDDVWQKASYQSTGAQDPLTIELSTISSGTVMGPLHEVAIFALGKLKGNLFYNTYTSPQAGSNGAVMRLELGATSPQVLLTDVGISPFGPCWSCHSLSAGGTVLVAQHHQYPGGPYTSGSFDLVANPNTSPPPQVQIPSSQAEMGLGAVSPDGTKVLTMGSPGDSTSNGGTFPDGPGNVPGMIGPALTKLLDTATGQQYPLTGWNVQYAKMPSFSPDGTMVVFNWHEDSNGHSLAVADFDNNANAMSNVRVIYKDDTLYPGWPWITPDNKEVVFVLGSTPDYVSGYPGRVGIASSDLWTVDIATGNARPLARANGYMSPTGASTYLPEPGRDEHLEFFPTMSPIAEGGYFWVFFTSRRTYGNTITQDSSDATTKKIWVSAYNIRTGDVIADPSNPPFYLPGQEDTSGNIRAFAALEPCHKDGDACETGIDCCGGHCYMGSCGLPPPPPPPPPGQPPAPPPPTCSNTDERCTTAKDCCDPADQCIVHFCEIVVPPS